MLAAAAVAGDLTAQVFMAAVTVAAVSTAAERFHHGHGGKHFHHGHGRVGVFVGAPVVFGGWGYASPFYYPPPAYYYPSAPYYPPVYIEREYGQPVPQQPAPAYWYYCPDAKAYYPYVKECLGGWQQVAPQSPPPS